METEKEYLDYLNNLIKEGYIAESGKPLKCFCGNTSFIETDLIKEEHCVVEYKLQCNECNKIVGYWSYGYWQL